MTTEDVVEEIFKEIDLRSYNGCQYIWWTTRGTLVHITVLLDDPIEYKTDLVEPGSIDGIKKFCLHALNELIPQFVSVIEPND